MFAPTLPLFPSFAAQRNATLAASRRLKSFLRDARLLSLPDWLPEYDVEPLPPRLAPFGYGQLGEEDDFTSAARSLWKDADAAGACRPVVGPRSPLQNCT